MQSMGSRDKKRWCGKDHNFDHHGISAGQGRLRHFLEHHPEIKEIVLCYDNDVDGKLADGTPHNHGQVRAEEEKRNFEAQGYRVYIQTPTQKDFNKMLTSLYDRPAVYVEEEADEMER